MPTTTQAMAGREQPESKDVQCKYFLALPPEIRTEIYSYIASSPETRHNLMAVSSQISEECTPLIFRQLRFTIHAPYPSALPAGLTQNAIQFAPRCTPDDCDRFYLRKMSGFRLRNIHSLAYNVTRIPEDRWQSPEADCSAMDELGRILLSQSGSLECLEEVVIYLKPGVVVAVREGKIDKEKLWSRVSEEGWDRMEQQLVRKGGPLQSWKISRRMDQDYVRIDVAKVVCLLKCVSSTFRKTKDNQTPGECMPVPALMVQHVT